MSGTSKRHIAPSESLSEIFQSVKTQVMGGGVKPLTQYQPDPLGFLTEVLGLKREQLVWDANAGYESHAWDGDKNPLMKMMSALANSQDVGVEAATGTQKSYTAAGLILWFLAAWEDSGVFTFAPKEDQLRNFIWMEIRKMWPRFKLHFPEAELLDLRIRMIPGDDRWGAIGYAVGVAAEEEIATKAQGMHREHMMLVYEETPGIHAAVMEAGENTCTAPHNIRLALGNPNHQQDTLHRFCKDSGVVHVRISALDHPNVVTGDASIVPGAVSTVSIARRVRRYGVDSPKYLSRVRGISPEESADALIRRSWIDSAVERWHTAMKLKQLSGDPLPGKSAKGVDVARSDNGDLAAVADFIGPVCTTVRAQRCPDTYKFAQELFADIQREDVEPHYVGIDPIGVGSGTIDALCNLLAAHRRKTGEPAARVRELNGSYKWHGALRAPDGGELDYIPTSAIFGNLRGAMACQLGVDFQHGAIAIPDDEELIEELLALRTEERANGATYLIEKAEIRDALGRSPDKADAVMYGNWVRPRQKDRPRPRALKAWEKTALPASPHDTYRPRPVSDESVGEYTGHGDAEIALLFRRALGNPLCGRYRVPRR